MLIGGNARDVENKKINVEAISRLARLELDDNEKQRLGREMRQFDEFAACLVRSMEKSGDIDATRHFSAATRQDMFMPSEVSPTELVSLSAAVKDGYISVPITVGKEDGE